jgi:hypothetical protein
MPHRKTRRCGHNFTRGYSSVVEHLRCIQGTGVRFSVAPRLDSSVGSSAGLKNRRPRFDPSSWHGQKRSTRSTPRSGRRAVTTRVVPHPGSQKRDAARLAQRQSACVTCRVAGVRVPHRVRELLHGAVQTRREMHLGLRPVGSLGTTEETQLRGRASGPDLHTRKARGGLKSR